MCLYVVFGISLDFYVFNMRGLYFYCDDFKINKICLGCYVDKVLMVGMVKV